MGQAVGDGLRRLSGRGGEVRARGRCGSAVMQLPGPAAPSLVRSIGEQQGLHLVPTAEELPTCQPQPASGIATRNAPRHRPHSRKY